jgi:hypothetical protein
LALKETENIALFEIPSIRALIEFHWNDARYYTYKALFVPFIIYLVSFSAYINVTDDLVDMDGFIYWLINIIVLAGFSLYFIWKEINQISNQGIMYLKDPWNYIDFTPPIVVMIILLINILRWETPLEKALKSIGSLFMWLKLLYFMRINKKTGSLIRMIFKVMAGIKTFLQVLFITIVAVAEASLSIIKKDKNEANDIGTYLLNSLSRLIDAIYNTY